MFHLVLDRRRNLVHQLHHVRTQLAGLGINDLEFFLYADGEAVSHGWPSGSVNRSAVALNKASLGTSPVSYPILSRPGREAGSLAARAAHVIPIKPALLAPFSWL